jgi:pimeloyl-ACP methyl ester carboxylesterase
MSNDLPPSQSFTHAGRRIAYRTWGHGSRVIVLTHGLLMDNRMFTKLGPTLAARGHQVVAVDMYGHGDSDQPHDMVAYSMTQYGADVVALLDHLGLEQAVVGGTSLGANVSLEVAVQAPSRVRALVVEMPVLESAIAAVGAVFVPLAFAIRSSMRGMRLVSKLTRLIPRSHWLVDIPIDFARRDPGSSLAILDGLTFGRIAPPVEERRAITQPTLVFGHPSDPIHPFSDANRTARELPNARFVRASSMYEWRFRPGRLDEELIAFLDEVWATPLAVAR